MFITVWWGCCWLTAPPIYTGPGTYCSQRHLSTRPGTSMDSDHHRGTPLSPSVQDTWCLALRDLKAAKTALKTGDYGADNVPTLNKTTKIPRWISSHSGPWVHLAMSCNGITASSYQIMLTPEQKNCKEWSSLQLSASAISDGEWHSDIIELYSVEFVGALEREML